LFGAVTNLRGVNTGTAGVKGGVLNNRGVEYAKGRVP